MIGTLHNLVCDFCAAASPPVTGETDARRVAYALGYRTLRQERLEAHLCAACAASEHRQRRALENAAVRVG